MRKYFFILLGLNGAVLMITLLLYKEIHIPESLHLHFTSGTRRSSPFTGPVPSTGPSPTTGPVPSTGPSPTTGPIPSTGPDTSKRPILSTVDPLQGHSYTGESWFPQWYTRYKQGRKIILLYTTLFGQTYWSEKNGPRLYEHMDGCPKEKNCLLTYDKSWIKEAAGLVFHARDVELQSSGRYSPSKLKEVRKAAPDSQKWIFLSHENPNRDVRLYRQFDGIFNWTATFSRKSNVFAPYLGYIRRETPLKELRNYAKEKTGLVAWAVSNCRSKLRLDYVLQLQRYVDVTVYGRCNHMFRKKGFCAQNDPKCREELASYKFYLAFENDFCHDYVTEKYWLRIIDSSVPVVMGSNYDEGVAIPGSYIDVSNFNTIKELADYLHYLDKNDDEYNKLYLYKEKYAVTGSSFFCSICEKLHSDDAKKHSQINLSEDFNYDRNCGVNKDKVMKIMNADNSTRT